jgi:hypothetical protein
MGKAGMEKLVWTSRNRLDENDSCPPAYEGQNQQSFSNKKLPVWGVLFQYVLFTSAPAHKYNEQSESEMMSFGLTRGQPGTHPPPLLILRVTQRFPGSD